MDLTRRHAAAVLASAAAAMLTGACSASNPGTSSTSGSASTGAAGGSTYNSPIASLKGVTLTYWTATQTATMADQVMTAFEAKTGAKFNKVIIPDVYETNAPTKLATGAKPDLATWQPTGSELALLKPSTDLLSLDDAPWLAKQVPAVRSLGEVDGHHYAAFVNSPSVIGIFYNKDVFKAAGVTATPKNFAQMLAIAKTVKAKGVAPFFGSVGDKWPTQWWPQVLVAEAAQKGLWDRVNTNKDSFSGPELLGAITTYETMVKDGLFNSDDTTSTYNESAPALLSGKAAMVLQISSFVSLMQASADTATINKKIGWFPISKDGNIPTSVPGGDNALVVFKSGNATQEGAAKQFLRFWLETDYPSYVDAAKVVSLEPAVPASASVPTVATTAAAALSSAVGSMQQSAIANPDFYVYLADMVNGTKTPAQVASTTQSQFVQLAKALGSQSF